MPEYMIGNIPVNFPFEPYDVQKAYMEKVIRCLNDGTNGLLESPTGTGKTLSLLCSSLAWVLSRKAEVQAHMQRNLATGASGTESQTASELFAQINEAKGVGSNWGVPKIIYASRTHSQLTQAMQELKRTSYSFMRAVVLGSRDQLCIHPEVMREQGNSNKIQMCKMRIQTKTCTFHVRVESKKDHPELRGPPIMDIEDLVKVGRKLKTCPYYSSKELVKDADITFMPYNYLLDPNALKANKVELNNTIIILDEAHNVEKLCEESASVQIRSSDIALAIDDVSYIMKAFTNESSSDFSDEPKDFTIDDLALLKEMLLDLEKAVDEIVVSNKSEGTTYPAGFMFDLLGKANINVGTYRIASELLEKLIQFMAVDSQNATFRKGGGFQVLQNLLTIAFVSKDEDFSKVYRSFKVHVQIEDPKLSHQKTTGVKGDGWHTTKAAVSKKTAKIINYWCFNPGFGMEQLLNKNVRSIILTSGTLAPLKPLIAELSIPIANCLENPHIVSKSQVCVKIIETGPDREQLNSNYQNRDNPKYINSLGRTIVSFCPIVPDGLLIFFPSYPVMNKCADSWQASGIWSQICRHKPIFVEPRNKETFNTTMNEYYEKIRDPESKGACFMAVCRGKVSEGLDFADCNGRAVIITGLPYPPLKDPRIVLKQRYLDDNRTKANELLTGSSWYSLEATRAVNQAIGRVIRHKNDYGAILLCDSRFNQQSHISQLSAWIREHLRTSQRHSSFGPVIGELSKFFRNAEKTLPKPSTRVTEKISVKIETSSEEVRSNLFADPSQVLQSKKNFHTALDMAIKVEKANSVSSWTPEDYSKAAGRSRTEQVPSAMDFMSRLNSDVFTIDFNKCKTETNINQNSCGSVAIHKRERTSPNSTMCSSPNPNNFSSEQIKKKRFKLTPNSSLSLTASPLTSSNPELAKYSFNKVKMFNDTQQQQTQELPVDRVALLKLLKSSLTTEKYSLFVKALMSYQSDSSLSDLMAVFTNIFDNPCLHYLFRGMRRFIKEPHKLKFDEMVADIL